ncbi:MAG TPA: peptide ABC transporter substrate-binding protein [Thermomicrobiales bacterium]|nr:peptide ABC transporter substrate-binding protein [Thermomicrobiales bacterium]
MTSRIGPTTPTPPFARLLEAGMVPRSRRDLMRVSALLAASAAAGSRGVVAAPARPATSSARFQTGDTETDVEIAIPFTPYGQDVTIDPHRTVNWGPFWVMFPYVWSGLLRFDENGAVEPDLAESVTPNDDGTVWTATLKEGIAFASGNPITANHFVMSWQRALDHTQLSPMAQFMEPLKGYADVLAATAIDAGFRAVDDTTIEITLSRPVSFFPSYLATFVWAVLDPDVLAADGDADPLLSGAGAGPWQITEFDPLARIVMEPNPHYWAPPSPSVSRIVWPIVTGGTADATALQLYRGDEAVSADVPLSLMETVQGDEALAAELVTIEDHSSVTAISMDFNQEPFNDVRVRQAIAAAIDKEAWAAEIWQGTYAPATSFSPPVLKTIANYEAPAGIAHDPEHAKSLLADAGFDPATSEIEITYFQPALDSPEDQERHRLLLQAIQDATGVEITHNTSLTREQITALAQDNGGRQFDIVQWWLATDTPALLSTVASQDSPYNAGWINWSAELEPVDETDPGSDAAAFDELVTQAEAELDEAARNDDYRRAEELLLQDAVYIPLGYWVQRYVQKPWLQGTRQGPWSGRTPVRIDEEVVVRGRPAT